MSVTSARPPAVASIDDLLDRMTLEEKVSLTAGRDWWHVPAVERLGIPELKVTDGPVGARGARTTGGPTSACFPSGTALASSWDTDLLGRVGAELGREAARKGAHVLLAPTINLHRSPLGGRSFECFSEDPVLTARLAVAYVRGVQSQGVAATAKHFVANECETDRFQVSSEVPERALRELYLLPFEAAVRDGGVLAVMSAYNRLGGTHCSQHEWLLTGVLRGEWGFDGLVMSDWFGTHSTAEALLAGLDLEMPGAPIHRGPRLRAAVETGEVPEGAVDAAVRRVLQLAERTGALRHGPGPERAEDTPDVRALLHEAAAAGIVLLKNDPVDGAPVLPLEGAGRLAVVGPAADPGAAMGGGSAEVSPHRTVSVLDGLRAALPDAEVLHEPGPRATRGTPRLDVRWLRTADGQHGFDLDYHAGPALEGEPVRREVARSGRVRLGEELDLEGWSARLTATLLVPVGGPHRFRVRGNARCRLLVDGEVVGDAGFDGGAALGPGARLEATVELSPGEEHRLELHAAPPTATGPALEGIVGLDLRCAPPQPDDDTAIEGAVEAARGADVAVVVVGTDGDWETEGRDRESLDLPGRQDELVRRVAAANPRTAVVVNSGAPVAMPWVEDVPAIVQLWFPGQEGGHAAAEVLLGHRDARGRLPLTFPRRIEDTPAHTSWPGEFGRVHYGEGLFVGYRWYDARAIEPLFPFGHGLSYTTFEWGDLVLEGPDAGGTVRASIDVGNTGDRPGTEVVQVYLSRPGSAVSRPPLELRGFAILHLEPGERDTAVIELDRRAFAHWHPGAHDWAVEPGEVTVLAGASSRDVRARAVVTLPG